MSVTPESIAIQVKLDGKQAEKGLKKIEKSLKGFGKIGKANNKIFGDFLRLAGFAGLTKMTIDAAHFAHSMEMLSQRTGIATGKLSQMQSVWAGLGTDAKAFSTFAGRLSSDLAKRYTAGGSAFYSAFANMGIQPLTASGNLKDIRELLGDIANYAQGLNVPDYAKMNILAERLGMPTEIASQLLHGREAWYKTYDELVQRTSSISEEAIKKNAETNQALAISLNNLKTASQESAAALSDYLIPTLNKISEFAKEYPKTTTAIGLGGLLYGGSFLMNAPKLLKGLLPTTIKSIPSLFPLFGVYATLMEMTGNNALGKKIKRTKPDMVDDLVNWADRTFSSSPSLDVMKLSKPKEKFWAETLKNWYESGVISSNELREMLGKDEYGGSFVTPLLKEMTKNAPEKFGEHGYSWQNFWGFNNTNGAERMIDYSTNFNQENNITIEGNADMPVVNEMVDRLGSIKIPDVLVMRAMTGG